MTSFLHIKTPKRRGVVKKMGTFFFAKRNCIKSYTSCVTPTTAPTRQTPNSLCLNLQFPISISVEKLSKLCGFSYEYFRKLFHNCYGCSPVKYINDLKLKRAKELLSSGFYTISDTALQSGFFDVSYFSRFFKKNVGISPIEYLNPLTHGDL